MKKISFFIIILSLFGIKLAFSATEMPYYAASGIEPNVLIILDRSGSMSGDVGGGSASTACPAAAYPNPLSATPPNDYSRICIARQVLFDLLDANNSNSVTDTPTSTADQTYLGVRLGYSRFINVPSSSPTGASEGGYAGGSIRVINDVGTAYTTLWSNINSLSTGGYTPLGTALSEALDYFTNSSAVTGDVCYTNGCRKNYVILVTDGEDTVTCTVDGSGAIDDRRATVYAARALRNGPDGIAGNADDIPVFIIGFGGSLPTDLQRTLNWAAYYGGTDNPTAANSGTTTSFTPGDSLCDSATGDANDPGVQDLSGYAFLASNASELATAIEQAINAARTGSYTRSQPVLTASGNRIYSGFFDLPGWRGHMDAWNVDNTPTSPTYGDIILTSPSNPPCTSSGTNALYELYDAGATLTNSGCTGYVAPNARTIYTAVGSPTLSRILFNISGTGNSSPQQIDLCTALNISGFDCANNYAVPDTSGSDNNPNELINFIRFSSSTFNGSGGTRDNSWRLGDIWHSTPTIVGPPVGKYRSIGYNAFRTNNANRQQILLVGTNDGMLHAFDDNGSSARGSELWSFIPNNLLGKLKDLSTGHNFFADASPTAGDVCLNTAACGKSGELASDWKTVVINGERDGGKGYFALDITDTTSPSFLWQFTDANLGNTWSKPVIGKVRVKNGSDYEERWAAFFGGGTSTIDDVGNRFYVVDIANGQLFGNGSNQTKYTIGGVTNKVPAAPRPVDLDGDYYVDTVFLGDYDGALWMLDLTDTNPNNWTNTSNYRKIFEPTLTHKTISCNIDGSQSLTNHGNNTHLSRPVYYMPAITLDSSFKPLIMFGTGFVDDYIDPTGDTIQNYFYVLRLENRSYTDISNPNEYVTELVVQALNPGERIVSAPVVFGGHVFYSTYQPPAIADCCDVGTGYIRWNELKSCGLSGIIDVGPGIPAGPVVANGKLYGNTSNNPKPIDPCSQPGANCPTPEGVNSEVIYWRERGR